MSSNPNRLIHLEISVRATQTELLEGLDVWLRLGLIREGQVRGLCRQYLSCPLPSPVTVPSLPREANLTFSETEFAPEVQPEPQPIRQPSRVASIWQSFQDELSVRWLLFLGVFLVVVSSGVLAATQWTRFPAAGQYGVLWAYTLVFGVLGWRMSRQEELQLTARTLRTIALLLIPVNFWAMDTFGLWGNPLEWGTSAIAAVSLSGLGWLLGRDKQLAPLYTLTFLGLSFLHWGWSVANFAPIGIYLGTIAAAGLLRLPSGEGEKPKGKGYVIFALAVLLARGIFVAQLPLEVLGLAVGICGWLLGSEGLDHAVEPLEPSQWSRATLYQLLGIILLGFGWAVSVREAFPWQATAISILGLWFFYERLQRYGKRRDLTAIFAIGLQGLFLLQALIPSGFRDRAIALLTQITQYDKIPLLFACAGIFAYLLVFLSFCGRFHREERKKLADWGEFLVLSGGSILAGGAILEPPLRSFNLVLLTLSFALVTRRRESRDRSLVYLTHLLGLCAIASSIDALFPTLPQHLWAAILLALGIVEWGISILDREPQDNPNQHLTRSCWYFGFILAGLSYTLFASVLTDLSNPTPEGIAQWSLIWLFTPLTLTGVASFSNRPRRIQAAWWSTVALIAAQLLVLEDYNLRVLGLAFACGLMLVNSRYLLKLPAAIVHVGFVLSFIVALVWNKIGLPKWLVLGAVVIFALWLLRAFFRSLQGSWAALYARSCDAWAVGIAGLELLLLSALSAAGYIAFVGADWYYLLASGLIGQAIIFRAFFSPNNLAVWGIGWSFELCLAQIVLLQDGSALELAIANISTALILGVATEVLWVQRIRLGELAAVQFFPLVYALLALLFRLDNFTAYTGFITLGTALTGICVGRRRSGWKWMSYCAIALLSIGWYELVIYQMLQAPKGNPADGLIILAGVACAIALLYHLLAWVWHSRVGEQFLNFNVAEIIITARIHWGISSVLMLLSALLSFDTPRFSVLGIALCFLLATYAVLQGRNRELNQGNGWIYGGLIEFVGTCYYIRLLYPSLAPLDDWFGILFGIFAIILYQLPWERWGWHSKPWQNGAILIPAIAILTTIETISYPNLIGVAAFYAWIANRESNLRWSYFSLVLIDWTMIHWFEQQNLTDPLWGASLLGLSILYIAQFDPSFNKSLRHRLRVLGSGVICVIALLFHQDTGLIPAILSLIAIFAGLGLRIRAFLYVGTVTFLLTASYQLLVLINQNVVSKWIVGLIAGIILIFIAANFERRRDRIIAAVQNWVARLGEWD
ncbi:DUF2157 domain-containing protein [Lusitaniella coriacea LEGE 07157]|uniref:DUF2157 domain-containing protein n=1 Tax=Lusitaniella coriacea LEGE 07157 TaxID=945747 RepID=A0A8J7DZ14_9CYAN|nr:DUF2157 domain-containing protein [Lusitaniella coriacea]MBE9118179.1 DUF2157 domain-containing protein [Lusitaniella coriacea LEGE 07157]